MSVLSFSSQDIKNDILSHCGELTDGTSDYDTSGDGRVLRFMNKAYLAILASSDEFDMDLGEPWQWAMNQTPATIILQPKQTGSITATNGSSTITFSTAPSINLKGRDITFAGSPEWYKISAHTGTSTTATLDSVFTDPTGSYAFTAVQLEYNLLPNANGILRLVAPFVCYRFQDFQGDNENKIYFMDKKIMERDYPKHRIEEGVPTFCTIIYHNPSTGAVTVRFNKYAIDQTRVEYDYIGIPDALQDLSTDNCIIPFTFKDSLTYAATYMLLIDKSDDRAEKYLALTQAKLKAMRQAENKQKVDTAKNRGRLIPRGDGYWMSKRYVVQEVT